MKSVNKEKPLINVVLHRSTLQSKNFVFRYWNTFLNKCGYIAHHFKAHFSLKFFYFIIFLVVAWLMLKYLINYSGTTYWFTIFEDCTPFIVILKYLLFSLLYNIFLQFIYLFFYFLFVVNFVIHWNEKALGSHVFPIPISPPTSLPTRSLQVLPEHQVRALVSCIQPGPVICFTLCYFANDITFWVFYIYFRLWKLY